MIHSNYMVINVHVSALQFFLKFDHGSEKVDDCILSWLRLQCKHCEPYAVLSLGHHCFYLVSCVSLTCLLPVTLIA